MKRRPTPELLDTDAGTMREIEGSLRDLRSFNLYLGGVNTTREMLAHVARATGHMHLSLLEVAAGTGFAPLHAISHLGRNGISVRITLLDRSTAHLPKNGSVPKVAADALSLPFADSSFDLVSCTLFAHHLPPDAMVHFTREALRVARLAFLVNDLVRSPLHLALAYAGIPLYRSRITRHDAPASVKQAYTVEEMHEMLLKGGAARAELKTRYLFRMGAIAWKHDANVI
jgi:ubiquinone/menaquinone biosynthesis C-methylase UbiE